MAIRNKVNVFIDGINRTHWVVMPIKWGNFLDEQLDECYLSLRMIPVREFKPMTPVEIDFTNELYWYDVTERKQKITKKYIVANDSGVIECPVGKNAWNHDLYLIEITKVAECIVVDTLTYTNDLGRNYTVNAGLATPYIEDIKG